MEEAIALSFGKNPKVVSLEKIKAASELSPFGSPFVDKYEKIHDLVLRAKAWNQLYDPALPSLFIAWAKRNDIDITKELEEQVMVRSGNIGDWKTAYDNLAVEYKKLGEKWLADYKAQGEKSWAAYKDLADTDLALIREKSEEIIKLTRDKKLLEDSVTELRKNSQDNNEKPLKTRERDTLLKLIIGMAVTGYRYVPTAAKNSAVSEIASDLNDLGIGVSDDTVRKWLTEAAQLLPAEPQKP